MGPKLDRLHIHFGPPNPVKWGPSLAAASRNSVKWETAIRQVGNSSIIQYTLLYLISALHQMFHQMLFLRVPGALLCFSEERHCPYGAPPECARETKKRRALRQHF